MSDTRAMTTVEEPCPQPMSAARAPDIVQVLLLLGRLYEGRPDRARAGFQLLTEEPIEEPVGASAVAIGLQHGQAAADRAEIEALVLLVAAAERSGGEVPGQAEEPAALLGIGTDALQVDSVEGALIFRVRPGDTQETLNYRAFIDLRVQHFCPISSPENGHELSGRFASRP